LALPVDFARPAVQTFEGRQLRLGIDSALATALRRIGAARNASLFMTLLAATNVLLSRMTGQRDITVGSPMAGRTHPDLEDQVGYCVNTLPLRTGVRRSETFASLLDRVRDIVSAAIEHQSYPLDRLVDDLDLPRDLARSPLFDVVVAIEPMHRDALS